jgi:arylsulfatase A-like enzyme
MKNKNVLMIVVDDLRQDQFYEHANEYMRGLMEQGAYFSKAMSTAVHTSPSFASMLTGTYPFQHKIYSLYGYKLNENVTTLPEILSKNGYTTMAFVSGPLTKDIQLHRGFDVYDYRRQDDLITGSVKKGIVRKIKEAKEPWFAMIHIWGLHDRFTGKSDELLRVKLAERKHGIYMFFRNGLERLGIREIVKKIIRKRPVSYVDDDESDSADYTESVKYHIGMLEGLIREISPDFLILTADHGERMMETPADLNRLKLINAKHGYHVHDYLLNVPLLLSGKGIPKMKSGCLVRTIDIFPTILDFIGIRHDGKIMGESLLKKPLNDRTLLCGARGTCLKDDEWIECIRTGRYKYFYRPFRKDQEETLIDLEADPREERNIISEKREVADRLRKQMDDIKKGEDLSTKQTLEVSAEMEKKLKALGYI